MGNDTVMRRKLHIVIRLASFRPSTGWVDREHPWDAARKVEMKTGKEQLSNWHQYLLRNTCWTANPPSEPESQGRWRWGVPGVLVSPWDQGATRLPSAHLVRVDPVEVTESGRGPGKIGGSRIGGRGARSCRGSVCRWRRPLPTSGLASPAAHSSTPPVTAPDRTMLAVAVSSASAVGSVPPFVA